MQKWAGQLNRAASRGLRLMSGVGEVPVSSMPFDGLDRGVRVSASRRQDAQWKQAEKLDITLVFLEGGTGVGKSTLTYKLEKMGYRVVYEGFVDLCRKNAALGYSPTSACLTLKWSSALLKKIEEAKDAHSRGQIKGGVVFFDRSFLTPAIYARGLPVAHFMHQVMEEIRKLHPVVTVLCEADIYATNLRVAGRLFDSAPDEKGVRETLGEADASFQQEVVRRYEDLERQGHFDLVLNTSSSKLALPSLLHALGFHYDPPTFPGSPDAESPTDALPEKASH